MIKSETNYKAEYAFNKESGFCMARMVKKYKRALCCNETT